jgi:hypothetical protein
MVGPNGKSSSEVTLAEDYAEEKRNLLSDREGRGKWSWNDRLGRRQSTGRTDRHRANAQNGGAKQSNRRAA